MLLITLQASETLSLVSLRRLASLSLRGGKGVGGRVVEPDDGSCDEGDTEDERVGVVGRRAAVSVVHTLR